MTVAQALVALELDTLELEIDEAILTVTVNRPAVLNLSLIHI